MDKLQIVFWMLIGAAALFSARFVYLWSKKGSAWAVAKLKAWWSKAKVDLVALEGRVSTLEQTVGIKKAAAPAPAPAAAAPAPAAHS